ncbi:MAG: Protein dedA (Protein DSG-1) [uncultured bacterium]|nr:MAG: Protein dedA (Protein DSG-1) [uncultured bacterium]
MILLDWLHFLHSPEGLQQIITTAGLSALIAIVFAETGLLLGFFLPGDSLLVTAGILSSSTLTGGEPVLDYWVTVLALMLAAMIGNQVGFFLGHKTGPKIFKREDNRFFKKKYVEEAQAFYHRHGGLAIMMAQFVPIMRTFVPFVAGVAQMVYPRFISYNVVGAIIWVFSMVSLGHFVGKTPLGEKIHLVILTVIFVSVLPLFISVIRRFLKPKL